MENKTIRQHNVRLYGNICMAGYSLSRQNPLTMHHIIPLSEGGKTTLENGSNISNLAHTGIHIVSYDDYIKAREIIDYLLYYKEFKDDQARLDFAIWLRNEITKLDYVETLTKDKLLMYKRRR